MTAQIGDQYKFKNSEYTIVARSAAMDFHPSEYGIMPETACTACWSGFWCVYNITDGGIFLEDLYVKPEYRGNGYGKSLLKKLAQIAVERGCGRLEWWCLDWNKPSIDFYLSLGAEPMDEWTTYRITGDTLIKMAEK